MIKYLLLGLLALWAISSMVSTCGRPSPMKVTPTEPTVPGAPAPSLVGTNEVAPSVPHDHAPAKTAEQEKKARLEEMVMKNLWAMKGAFGGVYKTDLKKISEAYLEGDDDKAIKLFKAGTRTGQIIVFPRNTPVIYLNEDDDYMQVQPKGTGGAFWVLKGKLYEEPAKKSKKKKLAVSAG